ncbi:hypothetical protein ACFLUU_04060 [Chloroflexota bacterium]
MKIKWLLCSVSVLLTALLWIGCSGAAEESTVLPESPTAEQPPSSAEPALPDSESVPESGPPASTVEESAPQFPSSAILWDESKNHIGEKTMVCGPVISTKYDTEILGKPTFLYVGQPGGFVVVILEKYRSRFTEPPERYYVGKTICVGGVVTEDKGIPQIEVQTPGQISEQTE